MIERIKSKDSEQGLKEIYTSYRNEFLLWAVRHHSCTMDEAMDVFQQSVIIFYENIVSGKLTEITTQVKTYIFSIGKNKILELLRSKKKLAPEFNDQIYEDSSTADSEMEEEYEEKYGKGTGGIRELVKSDIQLVKDKKDLSIDKNRKKE